MGVIREEHSGAALGFTVKSGWASAVLISGSAAAPCLSDAQRISLSDPGVPESRQPYHAGSGTARESGAELSQFVRAVERYGKQSVTRLIRRYQTQGYVLGGAGLVVGSLIEPERIANAHIRIHALEGKLFRDVIQTAAAQAGLICSTWRERDLYAFAAGFFTREEPQLRRIVAELGRSAEGPWRAEGKGAALAAWLVLAGARPLPAMEDPRSVNRTRSRRSPRGM